jgi:hypothetical protein
MANKNEGQPLREYENRKKRYKRRKRFIILVTFFVLVVLGIVYLIRLYNRDYKSYSVLHKTDIIGTNAVGYLAYDGSVVKYSKDGVAALDKDGSLLWNSSYEISKPIVDTCGKYVVIAEKDGRGIHIFNKKGQVNSFSTLYDIMKVEISSQGVVAALMEEEGGNRIILYDADGTVLSEVSTSMSEHGYPLDFSLSNDGKKLVTSYLSYTDGNLNNIISFYNFGPVGQQKKERFVGGFKYDDGSIIPRVNFLTNDMVCAYKDNGFILFSMEELPNQAHSEVLEGQIKSILYDDKYTGVVLQKEGTSSKQLVLYDLEGKKVLEQELDFDYETIYLSKDEIIMYDNMSCVIMKMNGKIKFRYTFENSINALYPANDFDRYYFADESELMEIKLEE